MVLQVLRYMKILQKWNVNGQNKQIIWNKILGQKGFADPKQEEEVVVEVQHWAEVELFSFPFPLSNLKLLDGQVM